MIGDFIDAGLGILGLSNADKQREADRENLEASFQQSIAGIKLGNKLDLQNQQAMKRYNYNMAKSAGMTDYEIFMGPVAGAGGGTSGSGATLGNAASQHGMAQMQADKDRQLAKFQTLAQVGADLAKTKMTTDTQKEIAGQQAGVNTRGQDIQKAIAEGRLELDRDTYDLNVSIAAHNINKTRAETKKLINEAALSEKNFVTAMKQLSMGPENLLVELTLRHHGIALNDGSFEKLPPEKRARILAQILSLSSTSYKEGKGAAALGADAADAGPGFVDSMGRIFQNPLGWFQSIESTQPNLGK